MKVIKNYGDLAGDAKRVAALKILEAGLLAIQPENVLQDSLFREESVLQIKNKRFDLKKYKRVFVVGFGKGSGEISLILEKHLGKYLTKGLVIDTVPVQFRKIAFTLGTHPLPSIQNIKFTERVLAEMADMTKDDLVLVVICGGGSALFESPHGMKLEQLIRVSGELINSGAGIAEINIIRKHLSKVKGGGLAKLLYPAKVVSLIFSDVPGNDLSVIASGPTVYESSSNKRALAIADKYKISKSLLPDSDLKELPKEPKYFAKVTNILMLSNMTALSAMQKTAADLGYKCFIFSDRVQGDARKIGKRLIDQTPPGKILLAGGESTIKVTGKGKGGRNQALVLASLPVPDDTLLVAFDSDGIDFYHFGGALGDKTTWQKASDLKLKAVDILKDDNSFEFFTKTGDGILTDKLKSNVADLIMVLKI